MNFEEAEFNPHQLQMLLSVEKAACGHKAN